MIKEMKVMKIENVKKEIVKVYQDALTDCDSAFVSVYEDMIYDINKAQSIDEIKVLLSKEDVEGFYILEEMFG
jgi:vacuolar-type H+-ATPase subunit D/Vma8